MRGVMSRQHAPHGSGVALLSLHEQPRVGLSASCLRGICAQYPQAKTANDKSTLVLVESPAKARKIEQYLGPGYQARFQSTTVTMHRPKHASSTAHQGLSRPQLTDREQLYPAIA